MTGLTIEKRDFFLFLCLSGLHLSSQGAINNQRRVPGKTIKVTAAAASSDVADAEAEGRKRLTTNAFFFFSFVSLPLVKVV